MQTTYPTSHVPGATRTAPKAAPRKPARANATVQPQSAGKPVELRLTMPEAISVGVAGSFTGWDPSRNPMRKDGTGEWKTTLTLPAGTHEYRFVVDGDWISDPTAGETVDNPFGQTNSVIRA